MSALLTDKIKRLQGPILVLGASGFIGANLLRALLQYREDIFGTAEHRVNSTHHQAINQIGKHLRVAARAPDGVIEAIETTDETWFCIGTQWHPECETASALDRQLFDNLTVWASKYEMSEALAAV